MKAVDVMTRDPISVHENETVGRVNELMDERNIRQVPVVNGRELIGIVTDRDVRAHLNRSLTEPPESYERARGSKVGDLMTTDPLSVAPDDDLREVIETL